MDWQWRGRLVSARVWRARCKAAVIAMGAGLLLLLPAQTALAQSGAVDIIVPILNPARLADSRVLFSTDRSADTALAPLAPFAAPQVGPLIKRFYDDDVDRRTTAWIPSSMEALAALSPVDRSEMVESGEHWVQVDLSEQMLVAWSGGVPVRAFIISSGLPATPTVTGVFRVHAKVRAQLMEGGAYETNNYYYLPNVQWVQYFFSDYALHGTYWHNDFGRPKSHGCINMTNADAKWVWDFLAPEWDGREWQSVANKEQGSVVIVTE